MEALVAVGLASNILQFVDFTTKLVRISNELRNNAASSENRDHRVITVHLETLAQSISDSAKAISQTSTIVSQEEKALQPVADKCCELAQNLLKRLDACGIQPSQNGSRLKRVKAAFKAIWNKREIGEISERLEHFKSQLTLYYVSQMRKTQVDQQAQQPSKDDIQAMLDKLDDIGSSINNTRLSLDGKLNVQHSKLLGSVDELRAENSRFHTETARQAAADQSVLLNRLDGLNDSMTTLNVSLQSVQTQQSSALESLAQVRVENSSLLASVVQQFPLAGNSGPSLRHALQPLFEEYADKIVGQVKKEFRGMARSEMDNFLKEALPALDRMQHRDAVDGDGYGTDHHDSEQSSFEQQNSAILDRQSSRHADKNSITMLYQKLKCIKTRLGVLSFVIRDRVHFDASGPPTRVYELTAQFNPSPRWFSTGVLITYENRSDSRGSPKIGFRLEAYRILEDDYEVWSAIEDGDTARIQNMLSRRLISTSDRDIDGETLLHYAVSWGRLDICKALVQSGANINARNGYGDSPIERAIDPSKLCVNPQGRDVFHYLQGLNGVELDGFWQSVDIIDILAIQLYNMVIYNGLKDLEQNLQDWKSLCQFVDLDLNIPGEMSFLEHLIVVLSFLSSSEEDEDEEFSRLKNDRALLVRITTFDAVVRQGIGSEGSANTIGKHVACAANCFRLEFEMAYKESLIANEATPTLSAPYRGYYVRPMVADSLNFLEYVILKEITWRPDCIFDVDVHRTASDWFYGRPWQHIWEEILEEHGFDVDWVYEEDERRKRAGVGETSAHEVSVGVDGSSMLEVRRRRGYENPSE